MFEALRATRYNPIFFSHTPLFSIFHTTHFPFHINNSMRHGPNRFVFALLKSLKSRLQNEGLINVLYKSEQKLFSCKA